MSTSTTLRRGLGDWSGVLDARAARTNQLLASLAIAAAIVFDLPELLVAWALVIVVGVVLGPAHIPAYRLYFGVIERLVGPGRLEDARAPRFAQLMGAVGMLGAAGLVAAGHDRVGWGLAAAVGLAAMYSVFFDFCVGCWTYRLSARLRGISSAATHRIEPSDVGLQLGPGQRAVVEFFHPMCHECLQWKARLGEASQPVAFVDVKQAPDLALKYGIAFVPTVVEIDDRGRVLAQLSR